MTRGRKLVLALGIAALAAAGFFLVLVFSFEEGSGPPTTNTDSSTLPNDAARVAFARKYLDFHSPVEATAFQITYWNNGFAPSDCDFTIVVKTAPGETERWAAGLKPGVSADVGTCTLLQGRDSRLATRSVPLIYGSNRCWRALFAAEGVVCVACTTL